MGWDVGVGCYSLLCLGDRSSGAQGAAPPLQSSAYLAPSRLSVSVGRKFQGFQIKLSTRVGKFQLSLSQSYPSITTGGCEMRCVMSPTGL